MAKEPAKPSQRARTEELRREIEAAAGGVWGGWHRPMRMGNFLWAMMVLVVFVGVVGAVAAWTREQPRVAVGRIMTTTEVAGVRFSTDDPAATEQARTMARAQAPRVYVEIPGVLAEIRSSLERLPLIAQEAPTIDSVEPGLRKQYGLTEAGLAALRQEVGESEISASWRDQVYRLVDELAVHPLLAREAAQLESQALNKEMALRRVDAPGQILVPSASMINVDAQDLPQHLRQLAREAGFGPALIDVVVARLAQPPKPTYSFDAAATVAAQDAAAAAVEPRVVTYPETDAIYRRGDVLTQAQANVVRRAMEARRASLPARHLWGSRAAAMGVVGAIAAVMMGYTVLFVPRIRRNPTRMAAIGALLGGAAVLACVSSAKLPDMIALTALAPTVFCAVVLCIAYSQRVAIAFGALHGLLVCTALDLPVGMYAALICGVGAAAWRLKEIRDRDTLIRAGVSMGMVLALVTMLVSLVELPITPAALVQAAKDAGWAGFGGLLVAGITLFILPSMERVFAITTGLTLIELRDPKQPVLRQLQQRAPGTYNHSLTLASLGEAAAEAIGADGLLTYVGALYHDIGKMNKPDYFVENQTPGFNRHDKLSPAMSLLVIVGHVKDGLELAREFNLPRPLWHFIESHHGTTLVEYFFHRARRTAETKNRAAAGGGEEDDGPTELEYRYPGPKPRTKEASIIMICDAVESATRAMADPTPSRIDALVRAIASKRLMDGQFEESDLTLRDLNLIVEAVSKTLASIYHGRIAYPGDEPRVGAGGKGVVPVSGTIGERAANGATAEAKPRATVRT